MKVACGLTLLDMLLALFLAGMLLNGLMKLWLVIQKAGKRQEAWLNINQKARMVTLFLTKRIRQAGRRCPPAHSYNPHLAILGYGPYERGWWGNRKRDTDGLELGECFYRDKQWRFTQLAYFVASTHRYTTKGKALFALYEKPKDGVRTELIEGVDSLQLRFGMLSVTQKDIRGYFKASSIRDWDKVRSVQVTLHFQEADGFLAREWHLYAAPRVR